jgi:hypothetical protein
MKESEVETIIQRAQAVSGGAALHHLRQQAAVHRQRFQVAVHGVGGVESSSFRSHVADWQERGKRLAATVRFKARSQVIQNVVALLEEFV